MGAMEPRDRLGLIRVLTTNLVGDEDAAAPLPMAEDLQYRIGGTHLEIIAQCKHLSMMERSGTVIAAIRRQLS